MNRQKKNANGITLIALVISIIIMLILAGVSLNLTIGENGIVTKAQAAKIAHEDAVWNENAETILAEALINKDNIEILTEEEIASANGDESVIEELKAEKMRAYLYAKFCELSENPDNVIVSVVGEEFMIIDGERVFRVNKNFSQGIKVAAEKILVETNQDWLFTPIGTGYCKLSACTKELSGVVTIPAILVDKENKVAYEVVGIGDDVFNYATRVTGIDFSKVNTTLKTIGARAFANCSNLEITIPDGLPTSITDIGDKAFYNCKKLVGNINTIQNQGYTLGKGVFMKCPNLTGDIQSVFNQNFYLENNVPVATEIEESQFSGFSGLTGNLIIPSYITKIGANAFYGCSSIEGLYFEDTSYTVDSNVYTGTVASCTEIGNYAFYDCGGISNHVIFPNSIKKIGEYAFATSGITGVTFGNLTNDIGIGAFYKCYSLAGTLEIPSTVSIIKQNSFYCTAITTLSLHSGLTDIGKQAFFECKSLSSIISDTKINNVTMSFPSSLTKISGHRAFQDCDALTDIYMPDSITSIGDEVFRICDNLKICRWSNSIQIIGVQSGGVKTEILPNPANITSISKAFHGCKNLGKTATGGTTDIISWIENTNLKSLSDCTFTNCAYLSGTYTGTLSSKQGTITITGNPFTGTSVIFSATIPSGIETITKNQFAGTTSITNVTTDADGNRVLTIPSTVTTIGEYAFSGSSAFDKLVIPKSVTSIGQYAFSSCTKLKNVQFAADSPITVFSDFLFYSSPINSITIPPTLNSIGDYCFWQAKLSSFTCPSSLRSIGNAAFSYSSLQSITLNNGLLSIGGYVFSGTSIKECTVPDSVTSVTSTFYRCNLKKLTVGSGITDIPNSFCGMPMSGDGSETEYGSLEEITFRGNVTSFGKYAFAKQPNLKTIKGLDWSKLTSIGQEAFYKCSSLTGSATISSTCSLGVDAFLDCPLEVSRGAK